MNRVLRIAELIAGQPARHRVFDPLVADWQRQLHEADGSAARITIVASGTLAFIRALAVCAVIDGAWMPPWRATAVALMAITAALAISIGVLLIAPVPLNAPRDLSEPMTQHWVLVWATTLVPPAFLLATFLLRRDAGATRRHAIAFTVLAAAATMAIVVNTTDDALQRRFDTFAVQERARELVLERYRAGDVAYRGRWYEDTLRTTVAERRANFERYRALMAAHRQEPPPTWSDRFAQVRPVMLTVMFAIMGWTLAGFGNATVRRAFGWWALAFAATITLTRIFWLIVQVPMPRTPAWVMPALFTSVACALTINAMRSRLFRA